MVKMCKFDSRKRCFHVSCSVFDRASGNVYLCSSFRGGVMFSRKRVRSPSRM